MQLTVVLGVPECNTPCILLVYDSVSDVVESPSGTPGTGLKGEDLVETSWLASLG